LKKFFRGTKTKNWYIYREKKTYLSQKQVYIFYFVITAQKKYHCELLDHILVKR